MSKTDSTRWLDWRIDDDDATIRPPRTCECGRQFMGEPDQTECLPCIGLRKPRANRLLDEYQDALIEQQWKALDEIERLRREERH